MASQTNGSNELYNLRWNSYFNNLINVFSDHQNQETLVDVTLGCEGQFIKAHRLVLSACSSYFQKIFQAHTTPQLLVLLNDVKFEHLRLVIQFMYKGEVKVADSEMQHFLQLGRMLQVKGLCSVELQDKQKQPVPEKVKTPEAAKNLTVKAAEKTEATTPVVKKRKLSPAPVDNKKRVAAPPTDKTSTSPVPPTDTKDTLHIPRPPNAFMIFANQWRKKLAVEYPNESNKDISVRLGNMWKSLSTETRDAFYEDARKADEEHKLKYPGYYYSPQEARHRKAVANISKVAQKPSSEFKKPELIEIKCEEEDDDDYMAQKSIADLKSAYK